MSLPGGNSLVINQYGRDANPTLRTDILDSIAAVRSRLLEIKAQAFRDHVYVTRGIVKCTINFTLLQRVSMEDIRASLLVLDVRYSVPEWALREILNAEILIRSSRGSPMVAAAEIKVEFTQL